jgi:hypothetical protein
MENSLLRTAVGTVAMVLMLTLPPVATAETVVPPGNSAATQYTETFPTTGGNAEVNTGLHGGGGGGGGGGRGGPRSPEKVLGTHTTTTLEAHGQEGRTVATLATAAAPPSAGKGGGKAAGGKSSGGGGGAQGGTGSGGAQTTGSAPNAGSSLDAQAVGGSSGLSEVLSRATGSSNGEMGIVLPLILLLTPIVALAYAWRRRQQDRVTS